MLSMLQGMCSLDPSPGASHPAGPHSSTSPAPTSPQHICDSAAGSEPRVRKAPGTKGLACPYSGYWCPSYPEQCEPQATQSSREIGRVPSARHRDSVGAHDLS